MNTKLEWALEYIGRGWPVLPLYEIAAGKCVCPDKIYKVGPDAKKWKCSPGKHPYGNLWRGLKDATLDPQAVKRWWGPTMWPNANIGVALWEAGLIDVAPDGIADLAEFIGNGLPETLSFVSGGGEGHRHFLFTRPEGAPRARLCVPDHFDVMSDGYAVFPPSNHVSGGVYSWQA